MNLVLATSLACMLQAAPPATLDLGVTAGKASATLNGELVSAGPIELQDGLNVLVIELAAGSGVTPTVQLGSQAFGVASGWQFRNDPPTRDWRTRFEGGEKVIRSAESLGQRCWLRKAFYVPPDGPRWFPNQTQVWLPRGARNLVRPYVNRPADLSLDDVTMVMSLPAGVKCVVVDGAIGQPSQSIQQDGRVARIGLGQLHGSGFELSARWGDAGGHTVSYEPAIAEGGTFDWRHLTADLVAPPGAVSLTPLIIKWQNRGISGTFWVDNLTVTAADGDRDLLGCGTFDEAGWGKTFASTAGEGVDGTRCVRIVAKPGDEARQAARWVRMDENAPVKVEAGKTYRVSLDLKCDQVVSAQKRGNVAALVDVSLDTPEGPQPISARLEAYGGALVEVAPTDQAMILPPLNDVRPKTTRITPCYYGDMFGDPLVRQAYAENAWASGITSIYGKSTNSVAAALRPKGLTVLLSLPWHPWNAIGELKAEGDHQATGFDGQPESNVVCPTWLLQHVDQLRPELSKLIGSVVSDGSYFGVDWDIEQPVIDPPSFCVCDRCLAAFKQTVAGAEVTVESLSTTRRDAWTSFRCSQNADLTGVVREVVKTADPNLEFSVYSGYQNLRTQEHYGVDWAKLAPHLDLGIAGYGGSPEDSVATDAALGDVAFMPGEMYYLSPTSDERAAPNPLSWTSRLLRCWLRGDRVGMLIWYLPSMDGGAFWGTSEAAALIATHEAFVQPAKRRPSTVVGTLPPENVFVFAKDGAAEAWFLNLSDEPIEGQVAVPGFITVGASEGVGLVVSPANGQLKVRLAPYGYGVARLGQ